MRIASVGHVVFAATMIGLGILCLIKGDFSPVWTPVPKGVPAREVLVYFCGFISVASGIGLLWGRTAVIAARVLLACLLLWLLVFRGPFIFLSPGVDTFWAASETGVMVAGVAVLVGLYARLAAVLSAFEIGMFTLLVWVPIMVAPIPKSAFQWSEVVVSTALTAGAWMVADSYRGMPWLAVNKR